MNKSMEAKHQEQSPLADPQILLDDNASKEARNHGLIAKKSG
jgi:hypothetical protein